METSRWYLGGGPCEKAFLDRPIEGDWPYLWIDATYEGEEQRPHRFGGRDRCRRGDGNGRREVLGLDVGPSEAETFWTGFLRKLARRGLRGVKLVIFDAHEGIKAAVAKVLSASWQRCRVGLLKKSSEGNYATATAPSMHIRARTVPRAL
jgi:putative transposase